MSLTYRLLTEQRHMQTIRLKSRFVLLALILLIIAPSVMAWRAMGQISRNAERSRVAHEVLDAHLVLADAGRALVQHIEAGSLPTANETRRLRSNVAKHANEIEKLIASEIAMRGPGGDEEELEELVRLNQITAALDQKTVGSGNGEWLKLISDAIAEERREVREMDQMESRAIISVQGLLIVATVSAAVLAILSALWLHRAYSRPLQQMLKGIQEVAKGNLSHKIAPQIDTEFNTVVDYFNRMSDTLNSQQTELASAYGALENTVLERTSELASANERLASSADRRKRFLADISHELRTPLANIRGEAEVAMRGAEKTTNEYQASLSRVAEQVNGMTRLVDDLLFVARSEAGDPKLKMRPVNLGDVLKTVVADVRLLIESDDGNILLQNSDEVSQISADTDRLRQMLHIVLNNAIQYSSGSPHIVVALLASPGGYTVMVQDRGIGISAREMPFIFDRYSRGTNAASQNDAGMGLGLPLAKAIAESHGGHISAESHEGQGTTIRIFLPKTENLRAVS